MRVQLSGRVSGLGSAYLLNENAEVHLFESMVASAGTATP